MHRIIGIIDWHYIIQSPKGLKKVKASKSNKKNVRDKIKTEKLLCLTIEFTCILV